MKKSDGVRVHYEKKNDGVRCDHEKESAGVTVDHKKKSDGLRVHHEKKSDWVTWLAALRGRWCWIFPGFPLISLVMMWLRGFASVLRDPPLYSLFSLSRVKCPNYL